MHVYTHCKGAYAICTYMYKHCVFIYNYDSDGQCCMFNANILIVTCMLP